MIQRILIRETCGRSQNEPPSSLVREGNRAIPVQPMYEDAPDDTVGATVAHKPCINATLGLYTNISCDSNGNARSLIGMFDGLRVTEDNDGVPVLPDFKVVTRICVINNPGAAENSLGLGAKFAFKIRLSKYDASSNQRIWKDLDDFTLDLNRMDIKTFLHEADGKYMNFTQITDINALKLEPGPGEYVIKLLMAELSENEEIHMLEDDRFVIQSAYPLIVYIRN